MSERIRHLADGTVKPKQDGFSKWISGRSRRREYWLWITPLLIVAVLLGATKIPGAILIVAPFSLCTQIRRFHDLGYSGWFAPASNVAVSVISFAAKGLLPADVAGLAALLINAAAIVALGAIPGQPRRNEYGEPPGRRRITKLEETFS